MNILYKKISGHWDESLGNYVKVAGVQRESQENYIKLAGKWIPRPAKYVRPTLVGASSWQAVTNIIFAFDPATSLIGGYSNAQWLAAYRVKNTPVHITFDQLLVLKRLVINNAHESGGQTNKGAKDCVLYGSLTSVSTDLVELHSFQLRQHITVNTSDPQEIDLPIITTPYKYYKLQVLNNWGQVDWMGIRQIDMYFED